MNRIFQISKYVLLVGLPCVLGVCLLVRQRYPDIEAAQWVFVIALAGFVGISTNTIAIRMLFRPKEPTFFGRQGIIPKNKIRIAQKIADETEKRLLNVETIMVHIEKGRVIEETVGTFSRALEQYLADPENRKTIADTIRKYYAAYADSLFTWATTASERYLADLIGKQLTVETVWSWIKPRLKTFFESPGLRERASRWIIDNLTRRIPEIADMLSAMLDRYIDNQVRWKRTLLKVVKEVSGVRKEIIADTIRDILNSPETYHYIVKIVEQNLDNIEEYFEQPDIQQKIERMHHTLKTYFLQTTREKAIPWARQRIDSFLESEQSWVIIDRYMVRVLNSLSSAFKAYLQRPEHVETIRRFIPGVIDKLNITQIVKENIEGQDTEEFERMIMKMTGENFAAIEALGGILGMLAGLAIKAPLFLIILPSGIAAFLGVEYVLMKIKKIFLDRR